MGPWRPAPAGRMLTPESMLDLTKIHNWLALTGMVLIIGFVLHQAAFRIEPVRKIVAASFGS